jgi:hypothetical protein
VKYRQKRPDLCQAAGQETFSPAVGLTGIGIWLGFLALAFAIKEGSR